MQAAQSRRAVWGPLNALILVLSFVGIGALALAAAGGLFMSRRAMRPVRESFERQRTFIADASHELKTPAHPDPGRRRGPLPRPRRY